MQDGHPCHLCCAQLFPKMADNNNEMLMPNVTIGAVSAFTGLTALGAGFGYKAGIFIENSSFLRDHSNPDATSTLTILGASFGTCIGALTASMIWDRYYNPLPIVYRNLTATRYRVVERYLAKYTGGTDDFWVVHARDTVHSRDVVLKMASLDKHRVRFPQNANAQIDETYRVLSKMESPHIVRPISLLKGARYCILEMEHIVGPSLYKFREEGKHLDFDQTLEFALALALGLREFWEKGESFGHFNDYGCNIILHPERKAVLIDPSYEPRGGRILEMEVWSGAVGSVGRLNDYIDREKSMTDILKERGEEDSTTIERAKKLQVILARADEYKNYDDLIRDLENL